MHLYLRLPLPALRRSSRWIFGLCLLLAGSSGPARAASYLDQAHPLHAELSREVASGELTDPEALMLAMTALFDPGALPGRFGAEFQEPLRCATRLVATALQRENELAPADRDRVQTWLRTPTGARRELTPTTISSPSGNFEIRFWTSGVDSISTVDTNPANGIPDFAEQVATDLEQSLFEEVSVMGFDGPATGGMPYVVELRALNGFGFTQEDAGSPGGTFIVMSSTYEGAPPNGDPEGSPRGASRITAAHELRHAGQYATSAWSEPGLWVELDAMWMEDQVFDDVNDYLRLIASGGPVTHPELPLDDGGSGSYPECVFERWMEARAGTQSIRDYWERRRLMPLEPVVDSYESAIGLSIAPLDSAWLDFSLFNLQTGTRARSGFGYPEGASFPTAPTRAEADSLPASFGSGLAHLSAKFYRVTGFDTNDMDVRVRVRQPDGANLRFAALIERADGIRNIEALEASSADTTFVLGVPGSNISELFLVAANGAKSGPLEWFFLEVSETEALGPLPQPVIEAPWTLVDVVSGTTTKLSISLRNTGSTASNFAWTARAVVPDPVVARRSVAGSTLIFDRTSYTPGEAVDFAVGLYNGSPSFELLSGVDLQLPVGVSVVSAETLIGEGGLQLVYNGFDAMSSTASWIDPDGGFGAVLGGTTALGHMRLAFDTTLTGDLGFNWTVNGDGYGISPHQSSGLLTLTGPATPRLEILATLPMPTAVAGENSTINWFSAEPGPVTLELSRDDGTTWETLAMDIANTGSWVWPVTGPPGPMSRLRVLANGATSPASVPFALVEPVSWASMSPASGNLAGHDGAGLFLQIDATSLGPGSYPVTVDLRDDSRGISTSVPIVVQIVSSPVAAPPLPRTRVTGARPNPFNPRTRIEFELAREMPVELGILDLRGRLVRQLFSGPLPAGPQSILWDGRDAEGEDVGSGTYIYRLQADDRMFSGKLSLIR